MKCNCRALSGSCRTAPEILFAFREHSATERIGRFPEFLVKANVCVRKRLTAALHDFFRRHMQLRHRKAHAESPVPPGGKGRHMLWRETARGQNIAKGAQI